METDSQDHTAGSLDMLVEGVVASIEAVKHLAHTAAWSDIPTRIVQDWMDVTAVVAEGSACTVASHRLGAVIVEDLGVRADGGNGHWDNLTVCRWDLSEYMAVVEGSA